MTWSEFGALSNPDSGVEDKVYGLHWNGMVDHAFEKPHTFIVRQTATKAEALYGYGNNNAGKIAFTSTDLTDCSTMFQSIMDAINTLGGGSVKVTGYGTSKPYYLKTQVLLPDSGHLTLIGDGPEWTVFQIPVNYDNNMFRFTGVKTAASFFNRFQDFEMIGNDSTGGVTNSGFVLDATTYGMTDTIFDNLFIRNFKQDCIYLDTSNTWANKIVDCTLELGGRSLIYHLGGSDFRVHNTKFLYNNGNYAVLEQGTAYSNYSQCWFYKNMRRAIHLAGGTLANISQCKFAANSYGTAATYDDILVDSGNTYGITDCDFAGGADAAHKVRAGVFVNLSTTYCNVLGNRFYGSDFDTAKIYVQQPTTVSDILIRNNLRFNPYGTITNPFNNTKNTIGLGVGTVAIPTSTTVYTVFALDQIITSTDSGNSDAVITIQNPSGVTIESVTVNLLPANTPRFSHFLPIGFKISWAFTGAAPTVVACGV